MRFGLAAMAVSLGRSGGQASLATADEVQALLGAPAGFVGPVKLAGGAPVSNGPTNSLTLPAPANTTFYRLCQQP